MEVFRPGMMQTERRSPPFGCVKTKGLVSCLCVVFFFSSCSVLRHASPVGASENALPHICVDVYCSEGFLAHPPEQSDALRCRESIGRIAFLVFRNRKQRLATLVKARRVLWCVDAVLRVHDS